MRRLGQAVLWVLVVMLLVRGVAQVFARQPAAAVRIGASRFAGVAG